MVRAFALGGVALIVVVACGSGGTGSSGGSVQTESAYVESCVSRATRCALDSGSGVSSDNIRANCTEDYRCGTQAYEADRASKLLDCYVARDCSASQSSCSKPIRESATDADAIAYVEKCESKRNACSFDKDYCEDGRAFMRTVRDAFNACFDLDCSTNKKAVSDCLDVALKARIPACD